MIDLIIFLVLLSAGFFFGRWNEAKHFRSIRAREAKLRGLMLFSERLPPPQSAPVACHLVAGSCVVSVDYFKSFVAGLRNLFGGRVSSYETLLDRARREAILRMKQEAADQGAVLIVNVKLETTSISGENPNSPTSVEVLAYGTALTPRT
ncbi:MAG: YbjQ family protein [Pseudomonadota bacterium]